MRARGLVRAATAVAILAAVPVLLVYLFRQEASVRFNGVVESGAESVGPVEAARIVSIEVVEGQRVRAGDVLVRFDSADRLLDDSINEVKLREYEQNLVRRRETLADNERACRQLVRETEVKLEECRMDRVRDEAELAGIILTPAFSNSETSFPKIVCAFLTGISLSQPRTTGPNLPRKSDMGLTCPASTAPS